MKSLKLCLAAAMVVAMFMLTSCLKGDNTTEGVAYGVIESSMNGNLAIVDDNGTKVYAPIFDSFKEEDCVGFVYKIDYDEQQSDKFLTATVTQHVVCDKWYAKPNVGDTTVNSLTSSEIAINQIQSLQYVKGYLFANIGLKNVAEDQKNSFSISYDLNETPDKNGNGNVYKLYVRSNMVSPGDKTPRDASLINAFNLKSFFDRLYEMEKGKRYVQFKCVFIKSYDLENKQIEWASSEVTALPIPFKKNI